MAGFVGAVAAGSWNMARGIATSGAVRGAGRYAMSGAGNYLRSGTHLRAMSGVTRNYGLARGMGGWGRAFGLGFLAFEAYSGYQREGAWGAAKGVATGALWSYGIELALGSAALPVAIGAAAIGGGLALNKWAAEKGESYMKGKQNLEFGSGVSDQYGMAATMRRRSMAALNQSRISGGMGLGNEAMRQYQPYFR